MVAQQGVTSFGLQVKPVFALPYFDPLTELKRTDLSGTIELNGGIAFGMSVRVGLTRIISLETGIGQIQRRYSFGLVNDTSGYSESGTVRYVGYEVPITALAHIRTGERTYMNAALGFSADLYPSDVQSELEEGFIYLYRNNWAQFGVVGNLGWEYRTPKSGILYLGVTLHRPFGDMAIADLTYWDVRRNYLPYPMRGALNGGYFTADLRYYFHEDPSRPARDKR
ncbi:MAG: outer membrane beta-barrel protein [Flavobacteriales bacterium]|nr:outer membrane beta-barrel protein [Flavobacteriales bacterium]